jgi:hypothetical protein
MAAADFRKVVYVSTAEAMHCATKPALRNRNEEKRGEVQ